MSLSENGNGNGMVMPVGPMSGNGMGSFFGGEGSLFYLIILFFFFAMFGGGWGSNYGNPGGSGTTVITNDVQRGFDQQAVMGGLNGLTSAVTTGFANAEISRCNSQANILQSMNNLSMGLQQCCCDNKAGLADLKYTVATEACADRQAVSDALKDLESSLSSKTQVIIDKLCQQEIDALKTQNANLQTQINLANLQASQSDQTAKVLADNANQTSILRNALNPTPIPAYVVQNPNGCGCGQNFFGCGCAA